MKKLHTYCVSVLAFFLFVHLLQAESSQATLDLKTKKPIKLFGDKVPDKLKIEINTYNTNNNKNSPTQGNISNSTSADTSVDTKQSSNQTNSQATTQLNSQTSTQTTIVRNQQEFAAKMYTRVKSEVSSAIYYYKARMHDAYSSSTQWIFNHRIHLLLAAGIISYATACYLVHRGFNYFKYSSYWGSWKSELTFEQFLSTPQEQMTQELIVTIQTEYINEANPTDFIQPLVHFTKDIETEITTLHWYKKYFVILDQLYLSRITFIKPDYITDIQQKLERLAYIKQLFGQWLARQNLSHLFDQSPPHSFYQRITRSVKNILRSSTDTLSRSYQSKLDNESQKDR